MNHVRKFNEALHRIRAMSGEELHQLYYGAPLGRRPPPNDPVWERLTEINAAKVKRLNSRTDA